MAISFTPNERMSGSSITMRPAGFRIRHSSFRGFDRVGYMMKSIHHDNAVKEVTFEGCSLGL